jgi:hypothetical protein
MILFGLVHVVVQLMNNGVVGHVYTINHRIVVTIERHWQTHK